MSKKLYALKKENLKSLLEEMMVESNVYIPAKDSRNSIHNFFDLKEIASELSFEKDTDKRYKLNFIEKTKLSPKYIIYPQHEKLIDISFEKNLEKLDEVKINTDDLFEFKDAVIFGIKPCDTKAIDRLDRVFKEGIVKDPYYIKRREKTLLISIGCDFVFEDCFCATLGSLPYEFDSTDIGLMETADAFVVMFLSDKGQKTIEAFNKFFTAINTEEAQNYENIMTDKNKKSVEKMGLSWTDVDLEKIPGIMSESFGKDIWKKISEKCISCGACTFVCPTCYCFDIRDEQDAANVQRCRNWDFCTSFLYSLEASGHNPRNDISKRYKNKINCKYNYNYLRHKVLYCVGCGRCIDVCPVDMDIRNIVGSILKNHMKSNV